MFKLGNMLFFSSILVCFCKVNFVFFFQNLWTLQVCKYDFFSPKFIKKKKTPSQRWEQKVIFGANFKP